MNAFVHPTGGRDRHAEPEQLALDALVAPAWVLGGQADDQLLQLLVQWGSPGSAVGVGPGAGDQLPVPAQQRLWPDEKARPAGPGTARLMAASTARSAGSNLGRGVWRAARPAGDGAPGSPGPWRRRRGPAGRAAGWSGTGRGRRGSTACSGPPSRSAETPHYRATHGANCQLTDLTEFAHSTRPRPPASAAVRVAELGQDAGLIGAVDLARM